MYPFVPPHFRNPKMNLNPFASGLSHNYESLPGPRPRPPNNNTNITTNNNTKSSSSSMFKYSLLLLFLFLLVLSTYSTITNSSQINSLNEHLSTQNKLLKDTIAQFSKFNKTVTNGELETDIKSLRSQISTSQAAQTSELNSKYAEITSIVSSAKQQIDSQVAEVKTSVDQYKSDTQQQFSMENNFMIYQLAGTFSLIGGLISLWHVTSHLRNFNNPPIQRKILAILWMAPIYSTTAWFSLVFPSAQEYLGIVKDGYEAYVVYVFFSFLIMVWGNGSRSAVIHKLAMRSSHLSPPFGCGCFYRRRSLLDGGDRALAEAVLYQCQLACMQFVLLKPVLAIANFTLTRMHYYGGATKPMDYRAPQVSERNIASEPCDRECERLIQSCSFTSCSPRTCP